MVCLLLYHVLKPIITGAIFVYFAVGSCDYAKHIVKHWPGPLDYAEMHKKTIKAAERIFSCRRVWWDRSHCNPCAHYLHHKIDFFTPFSLFVPTISTAPPLENPTGCHCTIANTHSRFFSGKNTKENDVKLLAWNLDLDIRDELESANQLMSLTAS